jgi:hypothetical protein
MAIDDRYVMADITCKCGWQYVPISLKKEPIEECPHCGCCPVCGEDKLSLGVAVHQAPVWMKRCWNCGALDKAANDAARFINFVTTLK